MADNVVSLSRSDESTRLLRALRDIEWNLDHGYMQAALGTVRAAIRGSSITNGDDATCGLH